MMGGEYNIKRFDMRKLRKNTRIGVIGKPGTGKSTIIFDIMMNHKDIPIGLAMSGSEEANEAYSEKIAPGFVYNEFEESKVVTLSKYQKRKKHFERRNGIDPHSEQSAYAFLIMDDCMVDKKWVKTKTIRDIFKNGRHWDILFLLAMQYSLDIPPELRSGFDYIFLLKENLANNRKRLYEHYASIFPAFRDFCKVFDRITENFSCMVIDNRCLSNNVEDMIYYYKADYEKVSKPFRIGCPEMWNYDAENKRSN